MKLVPQRFKLTLYYSICLLILMLAVFLLLLRRFISWPWDPICYIVIALFVVVGVIGYLLAFFKFYYMVENDYLAVIKIGKEYRYEYNDIVYIEINNNSKNKTLTFYTKKHGYIYLTPDKGNSLLDILLKRCKNATTDYQAFKRDYPNAK